MPECNWGVWREVAGVALTQTDVAALLEDGATPERTFTSKAGKRFAAQPVRWPLRCRKFWCDTPSCPQRVFCERWPIAWLRPYQQRIEAVWATITQWSWTASAADVARVATPQGLPVSADTVFALRAAPDPPVGDVRVVGVDEWALRKGRTYAAIVVEQNDIRGSTCGTMTSRKRGPRGGGLIRRCGG